ncbi:MAG: RecQ family ATP-dependent DNA helicase, partial [Phycisphaerales bacterium]|nr:RecQ family ATP-dependent DNA helicase [Phycisphaerales bacterium]
SLMKDQVDGLRACGYPAAAIHSGLSPEEMRDEIALVRSGACRLVFASPERVLTPWFRELAMSAGVRTFAIDEAHCISQWGHDFRTEYRQLAELKRRFPGASIHAYTATATERVRADVIAQLELDDPEVLVGDFDRPNLTYRIVPRDRPSQQVADIIARHAREATIVYCISRKDTENLAAALVKQGVDARPYHAGLDSEERRRTQEAFAGESLDVVVATVAFGMGIDRSNVRCVIHAAMPKSIEHYQQETGRAGRDGLEAECVLLYSSADSLRWERLIERSAEQAGDPDAIIAAQTGLLNEVRRFCTGLVCRHRVLSEHFGQAWTREECGACDVCLGETKGAAASTVTAQKILSCVARVEQRFGLGHVVEVLAGGESETIRRYGHEALSTFGLLSDQPRKVIAAWVHQLIDQGLIDRTTGDYPVLQLNAESLSVLRGEREVMLTRSRKAGRGAASTVGKGWEGVDRDLFESLRTLRFTLAQEQGVPAYVIFGDATLRELARHAPVTRQAFREIHGVGDRKLERFGEAFISAIRSHRGESDPDPGEELQDSESSVRMTSGS